MFYFSFFLFFFPCLLAKKLRGTCLLLKMSILALSFLSFLIFLNLFYEVIFDDFCCKLSRVLFEKRLEHTSKSNESRRVNGSPRPDRALLPSGRCPREPLQQDPAEGCLSQTAEPGRASEGVAGGAGRQGGRTLLYVLSLSQALALGSICS